MTHDKRLENFLLFNVTKKIRIVKNLKTYNKHCMSAHDRLAVQIKSRGQILKVQKPDDHAMCGILITRTLCKPFIMIMNYDRKCFWFLNKLLFRASSREGTNFTVSNRHGSSNVANKPSAHSKKDYFVLYYMCIIILIM